MHGWHSTREGNRCSYIIHHVSDLQARSPSALMTASPLIRAASSLAKDDERVFWQEEIKISVRIQGQRGKYSEKARGDSLLCCLRHRRHHLPPCLILQICPSLHPLHHNSPSRISVSQQEENSRNCNVIQFKCILLRIYLQTLYLLYIIMTYFFLLIQILIWLLLNNKKDIFFPHLSNFKNKKTALNLLKIPLTVPSFPSSLSRTLSLSLSTDTSGQTIRNEREGEHIMLQHPKNPWWKSYRRLKGPQVRHHLVPWKPENQSGMGAVCPHKDPKRQHLQLTHMLLHLSEAMSSFLL